jgi:hypothetical protein
MSEPRKPPRLGNQNKIYDRGFSNPESARLYQDQWPGEPALKKAYEAGDQCDGCAFYARFNSDWGLCCFYRSRHYLETVFEHFTCGSFVREGNGPHSFTEDRQHHCRCGGAEIAVPRGYPRRREVRLPGAKNPR